MKVLFLDTNIFIQCRDLDQLPWAEVSDDNDYLLLFIPRPVQEEIDRHKQEGNSRRAKRARKASSFIRRIILSEDTKLTIKDAKPLVEISFTPPLSIGEKLPDILDLSRPDDRIIAEAMTYRNNYPDHDVSILTHDTNPLLTAKRCGLPYIVIPDDWLLTPEPDSKDKKIMELENRLRELQNKYPAIDISVVGDSGEEINDLSVEVVLFEELSENELKEILSEVKKTYPMTTHFAKDPPKTLPAQLTGLDAIHRAFGFTQRYIPPSDDEIEKYQNEEYPNWIDGVESFFESLPKKLENQTRCVSFSILISNYGTVPAENVIIEFKALGGIYFEPPSKNDENLPQNEISEFPPPPKPPKGRWVTKKSSFLNMIDGYRNAATGFVSPVYDSILRDIPRPFLTKQRDRNAFYWKNGKPGAPTKSWVFECEEFRHKVESESFDVIIIVPLVENKIEKGAVECSITAKNLPKPIKFHIHVGVTYFEGNTMDEAKKYVIGSGVK